MVGGQALWRKELRIMDFIITHAILSLFPLGVLILFKNFRQFAQAYFYISSCVSEAEFLNHVMRANGFPFAKLDLTNKKRGKSHACDFYISIISSRIIITDFNEINKRILAIIIIMIGVREHIFAIVKLIFVFGI